MLSTDERTEKLAVEMFLSLLKLSYFSSNMEGKVMGNPVSSVVIQQNRVNRSGSFK